MKKNGGSRFKDHLILVRQGTMYSIISYGAFLLLRNCIFTEDPQFLEIHLYFFKSHIKGQLISKLFFGILNFLQKTNQNKWTWGIISSKVELVWSFFDKSMTPKNHFQINWPLCQQIRLATTSEMILSHCAVSKVVMRSNFVLI